MNRASGQLVNQVESAIFSWPLEKDIAQKRSSSMVKQYIVTLEWHDSYGKAQQMLQRLVILS